MTPEAQTLLNIETGLYDKITTMAQKTLATNTEKRLPATLGVLTIIFVLACLPNLQGVLAWPLSASMNAGHFFAFGLLSLFLHWVFTCRLSTQQAYWVAALSAILLACLVEIIQPWFHRTQSLQDVSTSALGIISFLSAHYLWKRTGPLAWLKWPHTLLVLMLAFYIIYPVVMAWYSVFWRWQHETELGNFEEIVELQLWQPYSWRGTEAKVEFADNKYRVYRGKNALKVETGQAVSSGVNYDAGDRDWRPYNTLSFHIFNPEQAFNLILRIYDEAKLAKHNNYRKQFKILPGWQNIQIKLSDIEQGPRQRLLNMSAIRTLSFSINSASPTRIFYLDHVHLE